MSDERQPQPERRPTSFPVTDNAAAQDHPVPPMPHRKPQSFDGPVNLTPETDDPFSAMDPPSVVEPAKRKSWSLGTIAASAFGLLLSLAFGLWVDDLVRKLFDRSTVVGTIGLVVLAIFLIAFFSLLIREVAGLWRLNSVLALKAEAEWAKQERKPAPARAVIARLQALFAERPETARGRAALAATQDDVIDGLHLLALAETELLAPLDLQARRYVLDAAKRVSVVTAISPRALVDIAYVLFESFRLIGRLASLYGGRPGAIGMIRLTRDVLAHLAVTGTIAVGDSLVQQFLGHGVASRLSARLGEGVINGLMTARIGIAAMDYCRPLSFHAVKRPGIGDFMTDLAPTITRGDNQKT